MYFSKARLKRRSSLPLHSTASEKQNDRKVLRYLIYAAVSILLLYFMFFRKKGHLPAEKEKGFPDSKIGIADAIPMRKNAGQYMLELQRGDDRIVYPPGLEYTNSTLDFQKIIAISSAGDVKAKEELKRAIKFSQLDIDIVDQLAGVSAELNEVPYKVSDLLSSKELAWARTHIHIWREIVEKGWTTAIIIQDKVDWEVDIRKFVPVMNEGLRMILDVDKPLAFPQEWDIIVLGGSYDTAQAIVEQGTVVELSSDLNFLPEVVEPWVANAIKKYYGNTKVRRLLQRSSTCMEIFAYAVSQKGARRLLALMAAGHQHRLEIDIANYIAAGQLNSFTLLPPFFVQSNDKSQLRKSVRQLLKAGEMGSSY